MALTTFLTRPLIMGLSGPDSGPSDERKRGQNPSGDEPKGERHGSKTFRENAVDSLIIAGLVFFGALGAEIITGGFTTIPFPPSPAVAYTAVIAAGLAFFMQLTAGRGIKVSDAIKERFLP
jgi:hypothetical protein